MKAVILAGGLGKRLKPLTNDRPKPMIEVLNKPILEWQIRWFKKHNIDEIIICLGYLKETIIDYLGSGNKFGIKIGYVVEDTPLGTGGALKNTSSLLTGSTDNGFFMTNGDILTNLDPHRLCKENKSSIALVPLRSPYGVVNIDKNSDVIGFDEKPEIPDKWINAGVYYFTKEIFEYLPDNGNIETTALPAMAKDGKLKGIRFIDIFWRSIDSHKDIDEAAKELDNNPT
ncbi:MAG TPA: nucleotidyltransferase family protein [Nitrososphaeraceae archaeon]|nr:nucleotidyltransferase family protein [Nitrososphaeraceae archaeon]